MSYVPAPMYLVFRPLNRLLSRSLGRLACRPWCEQGVRREAMASGFSQLQEIVAGGDGLDMDRRWARTQIFGLLVTFAWCLPVIPNLLAAARTDRDERRVKQTNESHPLNPPLRPHQRWTTIANK